VLLEDEVMFLRDSLVSRKTPIFKAMTGLTVALFDDVLWDLEPASARRSRPEWQRAVGAGQPCGVTPRDEFLLTVICPRHDVTQEAFFGLRPVHSTDTA
jgi:hypothetical protein